MVFFFIIIIIIIYITLSYMRTGSEKVANDAKRVAFKNKHGYTFGFRPGGKNMHGAGQTNTNKIYIYIYNIYIVLFDGDCIITGYRVPR